MPLLARFATRPLAVVALTFAPLAARGPRRRRTGVDGG